MDYGQTTNENNAEVNDAQDAKTAGVVNESIGSPLQANNQYQYADTSGNASPPNQNNTVTDGPTPLPPKPQNAFKLGSGQKGKEFDLPL